MRLAAALFLIWSATIASAQAQSGSARMEFLPIPDTLPAFLFAPDPLAGTMLRPFLEPGSSAAPEVVPEPGPPPIAVARIAPEDAATVPEAVPPQATEVMPGDVIPEPGAATAPVDPEAAPAVAGGTVTVIVENVESDNGMVNVAVCDTGLSREGCPYVRQVKAAAGFVETQFEDIPPGTYAVVGYHDENGNDEFDKLFGMPREPYALSSRAAEKLVPTFSDAALAIHAGENAIIIRLKRLGG